MPSKTLRSLAKDHASGVLDKVAYRKARDMFFDGVLTGEIKVEPIEYRPPLDFQDLDATMERERDRTQIKSVPVQKQPITPAPSAAPAPTPKQKPVPEIPHAEHLTKSESGFPITLIMGITIIIIIGLIIFLTLPLIYHNTGTVNNSITVTESDIPNSETQATGNTSAGEELIANFLAQNDWSNEKLQEFKSSWNSLTAEEQADGLASPIKGQLTNAIYQQLLEERALLGLGDTASVISRQNTLINFASELGINDPRLRVQGPE